MQAGLYRSSWECFRALLSPSAGGVTNNFYRGFGSTILREIPFAFLQFPLYEAGKTRVEQWLNRPEQQSHAPPGGPAHHHFQPRRQLDGWMCACLGSISGGIAAAATTPLDVVKTRLMLQQSAATQPSASPTTARQPAGVVSTFRSVLVEGGVSRLFSGVVPRVLWISAGGFVFFGAYEATKGYLAATPFFRNSNSSDQHRFQ